MKSYILTMTCMFTFLLLASSVSADIISINSGGSNNLVITPSKSLEGFFFPYEEISVGTIGGQDPVHSGGSSSTAGPFDIHIMATEEIYEEKSEIIAEIIIMNNGISSENETKFSIYLLSPSGKIYETSEEIIVSLKSGINTFSKVLKLPVDGELGGWRVYGIYGPDSSNPRTVFDSFEVTDETIKRNLLKEVLLKMILLVGIMIFMFKVENKDKK